VAIYYGTSSPSRDLVFPQDNFIPQQQTGERDCVKTAREWFRWDAEDINKTPEEETWAKFVALWDEALATHAASTTPPTRRVVELSDRLATLGPYLGETKYDASYIPGNMSEAEAADHVASISNGLSFDFFVGNNSTRPIEELVGHFISLLPDRHRAFAGYHKERMSPRNVEHAIYSRYLGVRSKPLGYDQETHKYTRENSQIQKVVVLDIDCQRPQFIQRHGQRNTAADIFNELPDKYRPLVAITNERSRNCHAAFELTISPEEEANPLDTKLKLKTAIANLTDAIGADPGYNGYTMRGPLFIPGMHKNRKPSESVNVYRRDEDGKVIRDSLYHTSSWYEPHAFRIADLQEFADYLNSRDTADDAVDVTATTAKTVVPKVAKKPKGCGVDFKRQLELAAVHPSDVHEEENNYLFSDIAINFARVQVGKYKRTNNFTGFYEAGLTYATARNALYRYPEPTDQVKATTHSVISYYFNNHRQAGPRKRKPHGNYYAFNSETASIASRHYRWGVDYVSQAKQAAAAGIPLSTFKLWKKQRKCAVRLAFARHPQLFVGACYPTAAQMDDNCLPLPFIIPLKSPSSICSPSFSSDRRGESNDGMVMEDVLERTVAMARGPPT
jgi:hypothetical protein